MRLLAGFGRFWWDFVIGDDWRIAAGVATVLAAGALLVAGTDLPDAAVAGIAWAGVVAVVAAALLRGSRV
jgi:hypothetical protein